MPEPYDFRAPRLFVETGLSTGSRVALDPSQAHYLTRVLRLGKGDDVLVFNGRDGEWRASIKTLAKRSCELTVQSQTRGQPPQRGPIYLFAPLKQARLDYTVQKAVEMGASRLSPVLTEFTQVRRINAARMRANSIEAAEQCGILAVPEIDPPARLLERLETWDAEIPLVFADEDTTDTDPISTLRRLRPGKVGVLIGPEGGFSPRERTALRDQPFVRPVSLGPRILRADTAGVAALALVQATLGDWQPTENLPK